MEDWDFPSNKELSVIAEAGVDSLGSLEQWHWIVVMNYLKSFLSCSIEKKRLTNSLICVEYVPFYRLPSWDCLLKDNP